MKRLFAIFMLSAAMWGVSTVCHAEKEEVDVWVSIDNPIGNHPVPRTPALLPTVFIDGHTLSFEDLWGEYMLQIVQDGVVVYSTAIVPGMTYVNLPSTLSGSYEFRFVADTYYYYGYIDL
jgi:hypothetical protein